MTTPQTKSETPVQMTREQIQDKIISNSFVNERGCWEWFRAKNSRGYGQICIGGTRSYLAHRISFKAFKDDPSGFLVCHKCDNPICCNPDHLFAGTDSENLQDAYNKGRKGKINKSEIAGMLKVNRPHKEIMREFGVASSAVSYWKKELGYV